MGRKNAPAETGSVEATTKMTSQKTYIVTGGGGFVGTALCKSLKVDGHRVISLARGEYPHLLDLGVECIKADLGTADLTWMSAFAGVDGVFHTAAKVDMWGKREAFVKANLHGTRNVIKACLSHKVRNLVFTSSPSVVHTGEDLINANESAPRAAHFSAFYPETKALSEAEVLAANGSELRVVALRPHLIWGPGDTGLIPAVLERARSGALKQVGDGNNLVDLTFIEECVAAHRLAMETLETNPEKCAGKAYFISQGEPVLLWGWINDVLKANGLPEIKKSVPAKLAMKVAVVCEFFSKILLNLGIEYPPRFSTFLVSEMATNHYFDISAAKRDLGYTPRNSMQDAMHKTFSAL